MDRQTHIMINDAGYAPEKSVWSSISESLMGAAGKLYGQRGTIVEGVGGWYEGQVSAQASRNMGVQFDSQATSYGLQMDLANLSGIMTGVQGEVIEYQALANRSEAIDKWAGRWGSTRAGYAAAGVAVDVGSPVLAAGKILKSLDTELMTIDTNAKIRRFNEVAVPLARAEIQRTQAQYAKKMAKTQSKVAQQSAKTSSTMGWLDAISTGFKVLGEIL